MNWMVLILTKCDHTCLYSLSRSRTITLISGANSLSGEKFWEGHIWSSPFRKRNRSRSHIRTCFWTTEVSMQLLVNHLWGKLPCTGTIWIQLMDGVNMLVVAEVSTKPMASRAIHCFGQEGPIPAKNTQPPRHVQFSCSVRPIFNSSQNIFPQIFLSGGEIFENFGDVRIIQTSLLKCIIKTDHMDIFLVTLA